MAYAAVFLRHRLIPGAPLVRLAVGEQPVDDDATDGEDEDEDGPQQLVRNGASRLEDFDCCGRRFVSEMHKARSGEQEMKEGGSYSRR